MNHDSISISWWLENYLASRIPENKSNVPQNKLNFNFPYIILIK